MMTSPRALLLSLLLTTTLGLSACKTSEEKAEDYYQSGLALLQQGDEDRAMIEFRNVFKYNGLHKEARKAYADTLLKEGKLQEAYSQYLRLIEQYPDTLDVRLTLAEMAIDGNDWEEGERHGRAAIALAPEDLRVQAIKLALDFRTAILAGDTTAQAGLADQAQALLTKLPESRITRRIVVGNLATGPQPLQAIPVIDDGLTINPKSLELNMLKFRILARARDAGTGAQLRHMFELFPDNADVTRNLIGWYMLQKDYDGAEAFLRQLAGPADSAPDAHVALVQFLQSARSPAIARAELDSLIAANQGTANGELYGGMRAAIVFAGGQHSDAIATLDAIVKGAAASDQTRKLKLILAQMQEATGNLVGARALVEEIIAEDPGNPAALKMRAGWFVADDKPGAAIVDLRTALDQSPQDTEILTLMASAFERDGSLDLAGDQLAKAVAMSDAAPTESLRYAQFLMRLGKVQVVNAVLSDARRANPLNPDILRASVRFYIEQGQWAPAQSVIDAYQALGLPNTATEIQQMQAAVLSGQNRIEESLALLENAAIKDDQSNASTLLIVQTQVRAGKPDAARAYLDTALAKTPQDKTLRILSANLDQILGRNSAAEATLRSLIAEDPNAESSVQLLYALLKTTDRAADASLVLQAGLAAQPKSRLLRWMQASELEATGKIDAAIAVYEALYTESSDDTVVANNLASLITAHHDDAASLTRAEAIAKRLRGLEVPAFRDTYGWIAFRQNKLDEALSHLEPAAKGLPNDALTQFHLAMVYDKLGRSADAIRQFDLALTLAGDAVPPPMAAAKVRLDELRAAAGGTPAP